MITATKKGRKLYQKKTRVGKLQSKKEFNSTQFILANKKLINLGFVVCCLVFKISRKHFITPTETIPPACFKIPFQIKQFLYKWGLLLAKYFCLTEVSETFFQILMQPFGLNWCEKTFKTRFAEHDHTRKEKKGAGFY